MRVLDGYQSVNISVWKTCGVESSRSLPWVEWLVVDEEEEQEGEEAEEEKQREKKKRRA